MPPERGAVPPVGLVLGAIASVQFGAALATTLFEALRRIPAGTFGVLMSLEPAVAALAGFLVVGQRLATLQALAIALVVAASAGAARGARERSPWLD